MIRQPEQEQLNRLMVKTLDQVFIMRAKEGLSCSLFEAQALTDLIKEDTFPGCHIQKRSNPDNWY